jgi:type I restriction enzyme S subunit
VKIIDNLDALFPDITARLSANIASRQKQYDYYRDKLIKFKDKAT